ncbi:MAG TPA: BTAD domain-containing putative transcriptional regulator [Streptosporangiaceae bacterium]
MTRIEFCLLGPMVVRSGGAVIPVPGGKLRAVLAALLLSQGQAVSLEDLAETLWGPGPPPTARVTIQNHVMRLRRALGAEGARITTRPPGYRIRADASELDVSRFETMLSAARAAARNQSWDSAAREAREALALWRGEPLADVDSQLLAMREVPRLAELRLQALETRVSADLRLGRHAEVITELRQLTSAYPLREQLHADLMLALYRADRQAEALAAYQHARKVLVDEIGSEPGTRLQEVHRRILAADPALIMQEATPATANTAPAVPRELPPAVHAFTGRADQLAALTSLLNTASGERPRTVIISAISGTAGVGKTALAMHWAHQVAARFPDGQLYVNLRGYDPDQPMPATDALAGFLRSLGVPDQAVPVAVRERAARYRSLLAGRQILVVLDNAGSVEQVRPLLPGDPACAVLVTSRDSLAGLVARDGAGRLDLDLLPLADAVDLLKRLIGERADDDPDTASRLAGQCCRLPLALRLAAELAVSRPAVSLGELAEELGDQQKRLDLLDIEGDPRTAVRAVLSWSYHHLGPAAARAFRLAGLHPGPGFDDYAVAALTGTPLGQAQHLLGQLVRGHLIQPTRPGQYGLHDLLRAYARELATTTDGEEERRAALTRLFDHYLYAATAAMVTLYPAEMAHPHEAAEPVTDGPPVSSRDDARAWLDTQLATLAAVARHAATHGWPGHAIKLAVTLHRHLDGSGHYPEAVAIHTQARHAAQLTGDHAAEATILTNLGLMHARQCRYPQAASHLQQALALSQQTGDLACAARAVGTLGIVSCQQGRYQQATGHYQQAMTLFRQIGNRTGEATTHTNLGNIQYRQGRYEQAARHLQRALALYQEIGNQAYEAYALELHGLINLRQGHYQEAAGHLEQALALSRRTGNQGCHAYTLTHIAEIELHQSRCQQAASNCRQAITLFRQIGDQAGQAVALAGLGKAALLQGHLQQASGHFEQALTLYRLTGVRSGQAGALNGLGSVLLAAGQPEQAHLQYSAGLDLADEVGEKEQQARAHDGLGRVAYATGNLAGARRHWQRALTIHTELGAPEADEIRGKLILDLPPESA